jgi:hypothetical protein
MLPRTAWIFGGGMLLGSLLSPLWVLAGAAWMQQQQKLFATDATSSSNADMVAVTGSYGNGVSVLYAIDTKRMHLCVYEARNGKEVRLVAARKIEYDFRIPEFNDSSEDKVRVKALEREWRTQPRQDDEKK